MKINLHIDRIVLEGLSVAPGQGHLVQAGMAAELSRLFAQGGLSAGLMEKRCLPQVTTRPIQLTPGRDPVRIGQEIARSVYGGISHEQNRHQ